MNRFHYSLQGSKFKWNEHWNYSTMGIFDTMNVDWTAFILKSLKPWKTLTRLWCVSINWCNNYCLGTSHQLGYGCWPCWARVSIFVWPLTLLLTYLAWSNLPKAQCFSWHSFRGSKGSQSSSMSVVSANTIVRSSNQMCAETAWLFLV